MTDEQSLREQVRRRYAAAAADGCCGDAGSERGTGVQSTNEHRGEIVFGRALYAGHDVGEEAALAGSLGCGVPTAVADLHEGETVLDLGSGTGGDVLISAARVGPSGCVIGLDMTTEMLQVARDNAARAGVENVEFVQGYLEDIPLSDATVDVVISNCVINLAADKALVLREAARVTRSGGRFAVSDVVADEEMDSETRADLASWTGCIAGALTEGEYLDLLTAAGWSEVSLERTHRVHAHASAAIVRAVRR